MDLSDLHAAAALVPAGAWAVGVSGGADSVALLRLLHPRPELRLHVVHLDHQTRGDSSAADARFVEELAAGLTLPCSVARREDLEPSVPGLPANPSARFRRLRLTLFSRVVAQHGLRGVLLAHHADDQAETVMHRLIRGSGPSGLAGMEPRSIVAGLEIRRPMLGVRRVMLREYLRELGQPWRDDASNVSPRYARNRLRMILADRQELVSRLLGLGDTCRALRAWCRASAPVLGARFAMRQLADLPDLLAREASRRWLIERGVPPAELEPPVIERLIRMSRDAAVAGVVQFPGSVVVRRRRGQVSADE